MLTILAIAVLLPVGVGALVLALDGRIARPERPPASERTAEPDADQTAAAHDPASQPKATYQPLRDRTADPAHHTGGRA